MAARPPDGAGATRAFLPVVLDAMPTELEKVIVMARIATSRGRRREFYERKSRGGWGSFIDREQIERRNAARMSDTLRTMPGVRLFTTSATLRRGVLSWLGVETYI
ncbi:MAG: hypothetical protein M3303_04755 [Gemmatimonadota bacterium]|nr:hypothetical protein [Gemmatimonadota bacterium]